MSKEYLKWADSFHLTTESHETHHDLFSFTKTDEHFVWFGLDLWFAFISHIKKSKIGDTIKYFCRIGYVNNCIHEEIRRRVELLDGVDSDKLTFKQTNLT